MAFSAATVIFLDIDGVLLPFGDEGIPLKPFANNGKNKASSCGSIFPDETLHALSYILETISGSVLVLSSTWRKRFKDEIILNFRKFGKKFGGPLQTIRFYDITDKTYNSERQWEIRRWLDNQQKKQQKQEEKQGSSHYNSSSKRKRFDANLIIKQWIVLDDEELLEGNHNLKYQKEFLGHVVKTSCNVGLTMDDAKFAIALYKEQQKIFKPL